MTDGLHTPILAPQATRPSNSLISGSEAFGLYNSLDERWENGVAFQPEQCTAAFGFDPCPPAVIPPKQEVRGADTVNVDEWVLYTSYSCSAFGYSRQQYEGVAQRQLLAALSKGIEEELWTGAIKPTNPNFANGAPVLVNAGAAVSLENALAGLADELSNCGTGQQGMIHMTTGTAEIAASRDLLLYDGSNLRTWSRGDIVVAGAGYPGSEPAGQTAPTATQAWIFASGPVAINHSEPIVVPDAESAAVRRDTNDITYFAESYITHYWDTCCLVAALVDFTL